MRGWFMDSITNGTRIVDSWSPWPWAAGPTNVNEHFDLDATNTTWPQQVPSPVGYAWKLNSNAALDGTPFYSINVPAPGSPYSTSDVVTSFTSDDNTVGCWFRIDGEHVGADYGVIWAFGGLSGDGVAAENVLGQLSYKAVSGAGYGNLHWLHEWGTGATQLYQFINNYRIKENEWYYVVVRRSNVVAGGSMDLEIFVNGEKILFLSGVTTPTGGSSSMWTIGTRPDTVFGVWEQSAQVSIAGLYMWDNALGDGQVNLDYQRGILYDSFTAVDAQVLSLDRKDNFPVFGPGRHLDFTNHLGVDWVKSLSINDSDESNTISAQIDFHKLSGSLNMSPLVTDSLLNDQDPASTSVDYSPLLTTGVSSIVEIRLARVPLGTVANDYQWSSMFQGVTDKIDQGSIDKLSLSARDYGSILINTMTETEYTYGSATVVVLIEAVIQSILNDNDDATNPNPLVYGSYPELELTTFGAPTWGVNEFKRQREPVMAQIEAVAKQIGWKVKFKFDPNPLINDWRISLYEPDRYNSFSTTAAATGLLDLPVANVPITSGNLTSMTQGAETTERLRNVVRIAYPSSETVQVLNPLPAGVVLEDQGLGGVDNEGNRTPAFITLRATDSVDEYRRRFMEVQEDSTSQIDTVSEAQTMAESALSDLSFPDLDSSLSTLCLFEAEVGDVGSVSSNDIYNTAKQQWAIRSTRHSISETANSSLTMHGKPSIGFKSWGAIESRPGMGPPPILGPSGVLTGRDFTTQIVGYDAANALTTSGLGGRFLQFRNSDFSIFTMGLNNPPDGWEIDGAGVWNADIIPNMSESASGTTSIEITDAVNFTGLQQTQDSYIPIDGDEFEPYTITATWKRPAGVSDDDLIVGIQWLEADKVTLAGATFSTTFTMDTSLNGTWFTSKFEGVLPPSGSTARWARIIFIRSNGATNDSIYVDSLSMYHCARKAKAVNGTNDAHNGVVGDWNVAVFYNPDNGIFPSYVYDFGDNWETDTGGTPRSWFNIRKSGLYQINAQVLVACNNVAGFQDGYGQIRCTKNGTYNISNLPVVASEIVAESNVVRMVDVNFCNFDWNTGAPLFDYYGAASLSTVQQFDVGDTVCIEWQGHRDISPGAPDDAVSACGFAEAKNSTWFELKLLLNE